MFNKPDLCHIAFPTVKCTDKLFIFRKHFKFSDISYAKITKGEIRLYKENRKRCIFMVDAMNKGHSNFVKRLRKEGIEIIDTRAEADRKMKV